MNLPKKQGQRLIPEYLLKYQEELIENHPDPSAEWGGGGGSTYTAGDGIDITDDEISVDDTIARTSDIPDVSKMVTTDTAQTITANKTFNNPDNGYVLDINNNGIEIGLKNTTIKGNLGYDKLYFFSPISGSCFYRGSSLDYFPTRSTGKYGISVRDYQDSSIVYDYYFVQGKSGEVATTDELFSGDYDDLTNKPTIPTYTSNLFLHNFRLVITTSGSYTSTIEATVLTKSSNQILTIAELISQLAALQATPYDDSVVGVIYGQWYRNDLTSAKETILGFGVVAGSTGNPRLYMTVPNGNGRSTNITFMSTSSAVKTVGWVNDLQNGSGYEVAAQCTDVVVPAII